MLCVSFGCASIEGTRNKSLTIQKISVDKQAGPLAILPVKENAAMPGLSSRIEDALFKAMRSNFRIKIVDAKTFGLRIAEKNLIGDFGQWKAGYEGTALLDPRPLSIFAQAADVQYLLMVQSTYLGREKIRAVETGYSGWVKDARNVWRTDLKILAEVIDSISGKVIWKGVGHAENISSIRRDIDFFFVIVHDRNPEVDHFISEMIQVATGGMATEIASIPAR